MNFLQQITATFIGALSAFIFSILLFYLTEKWKNSSNKKDLCQNIQKELDYNISFLEKYKDEFEKLLRKITANDKNPYIYFRFSKLQRLFITEGFNKGLLYNSLDIEDLTKFDDLLNHASLGIDQWAINELDSYKNDSKTQAQSLASFEFEKDNIEKYIIFLKDLKIKLKKLK
jgi:hypothetical protein